VCAVAGDVEASLRARVGAPCLHGHVALAQGLAAGEARGGDTCRRSFVKAAER
jgi:hypothetical protein